MTRPSDIKPREDEQPAALYKDWEVGAEFEPLPFTVTRDVVREYMSVVDADPRNYVIDGRAAAPTNVLFVYMMAVMYRKYPPQQGGIMIGNTVQFHNPVWADEDTDVVASGRVTNKFERKDRKYISYDVDFKRPDGTLLMTVNHTSSFPE